MATQATDSGYQLGGDWTISGVVGQLGHLNFSLQKLAVGCRKTVQIDCGKIEAIDMDGMQLLHVWLELVKMRDMETQLFNLPDQMQQCIKQLGYGDYYKKNVEYYHEYTAKQSDE